MSEPWYLNQFSIADFLDESLNVEDHWVTDKEIVVMFYPRNEADRYYSLEAAWAAWQRLS